MEGRTAQGLTGAARNFIFEQKYNSKDPGKYAPVPSSTGSLMPGEGDELAGTRNGPGMGIQLCRSCTEWSAGHPTEHSIANAYIDAISSAEHFVYIENQVT